MDANTNPTPAPAQLNHNTLPINATLKEAWESVHGFKGTFWLAFLIVLVVSMTFGVIQGIIQQPTTAVDHTIIQHIGSPISIIVLILSIIANIINFLFTDGLYYIALRRSANIAIQTRMIFIVFKSPLIGKLIILMLIKFLFVIAYVLLILLLGIAIPVTGHWYILLISCYTAITIFLLYVFLRLSLADLIILDKKLDAWDAITLSFHTTRGLIWRIAWLITLQILILLISIIPLGIGLIWSIPFLYLVFPTIYKRLIGISMTE